MGIYLEQGEWNSLFQHRHHAASLSQISNGTPAASKHQDGWSLCSAGQECITSVCVQMPQPQEQEQASAALRASRLLENSLWLQNQVSLFHFGVAYYIEMLKLMFYMFQLQVFEEKSIS